MVTGGAGYIGAHIVKSLKKSGHGVVAFDDLSAGRADNLDGSGTRLAVGSVLDRTALGEVCAGADAVVHLAAIGSVPGSTACSGGVSQIRSAFA